MKDYSKIETSSIFNKHVADKGLYPNYRKISQKLNKKKTNKPAFTMGKGRKWIVN